ncbi:Zinc ABC transporter, ATP-binding protein ZnuC [Escherichia coli ISC7]|uniref:Zinc ABC transporter, ATP-binding protein ZnuC n=1 Tax=Escherichia coli ISC7 TaxID=1432555 RepID=W1ETV0_ECOLX|nr:Zinc ABC transporter, ATP-binding protein ZnuC [Escherichia coli ISC7]
MTSLVSLENVSVSFGQRRVLSDVSLELKPGKNFDFTWAKWRR